LRLGRPECQRILVGYLNGPLSLTDWMDSGFPGYFDAQAVSGDAPRRGRRIRDAPDNRRSGPDDSHGTHFQTWHTGDRQCMPAVRSRKPVLFVLRNRCFAIFLSISQHNTPTEGVVRSKPLGPGEEAFAVLLGLRHTRETVRSTPPRDRLRAEGIAQESNRNHDADHENDGER